MPIEDFFEIDPIGLPVGNERASVCGKGSLRLRCQIDDVQVVVAKEGYELAIRTELRLFFLTRRLGEPGGLRAVKAGKVQIVLMVEECARSLRIHVE